MKKFTKIPAAIVFALCAFSAAAAETAAAPEVAGTTLAKFYNDGGLLMHVLLAISVFLVANVIYLFVTLRAGITVPRDAFNDIMEKVKADKLEEAAKVCKYKPCPFSYVAASAIRYALSVPVSDPIMLDAAMTGEGARQAARLNGRTQWLLDIASISPMIGLLGTVIGMFGAFNGVGSVTAEVVANKPVALAAGVMLALITTIAGLVVAIPAMAFYAWFRRQAARQVANLECACADLLTTMVSRFGRAN